MMEQEVSTQTMYIVALGAEYTFKATAATAKVIFGMIGKLSEKKTLSAAEKDFLKNASDGVATLVPVNRDDIDEFKKQCKHYGLQYTVFKKSIRNSDHFDVSVRTDQLARVNIILNKMNYGKVGAEEDTKKESPSQNESTTQTPKSNDETGVEVDGASDNKEDLDFNFAIKNGYVPPLFSPEGMSDEDKEVFLRRNHVDEFFASRPELWRPSLFPLGPQSKLSERQREILEECKNDPALGVALENGFSPHFADLEEMSSEEKVKEYQRRAGDLDEFFAKHPDINRPEEPIQESPIMTLSSNEETSFTKKQQGKVGHLDTLIEKARQKSAALNAPKAAEKIAQGLKEAPVPIGEKIGGSK